MDGATSKGTIISNKLVLSTDIFVSLTISKLFLPGRLHQTDCTFTNFNQKNIQISIQIIHYWPKAFDYKITQIIFNCKLVSQITRKKRNNNENFSKIDKKYSTAQCFYVLHY